MKVVILDAATLGEDLPLSPIAEKYSQTKVYATTTEEQISKRIDGFDVVIVNKLKMNEKTLNGVFPKLICITATGYDNIDIDFCKKNNIAVANVVGYSTESVAQVTAAMALNLATHIPEYTDYVNSGKYSESGLANCLTPAFYELNGKTWGIIGFGNIGKKVARIAEGLGCNILVNKRVPISDYTCVSIEELCEKSDVISIHAPLNDDTKNLIGKKELDLMKKSVILINVARGAVCDEKALADAILSKKIAGLGIDVYSKEPFDKTHPFAQIVGLPNVCLTPHMAWGAFEARSSCIEEILQNIIAFESGILRNRVDK